MNGGRLVALCHYSDTLLEIDHWAGLVSLTRVLFYKKNTLALLQASRG